jgi:hypothetical protein
MKLLFSLASAKNESGVKVKFSAVATIYFGDSEDEIAGRALRQFKENHPPPTWEGHDVEVKDLTEIAREFVREHG